MKSEKILVLYGSCPRGCAAAGCWVHLNFESQSKPKHRDSKRHYNRSYVECGHNYGNVKPKSER
jgi:hypothetical protein